MSDDYTELRAAVDEAVENENSRDCMPDDHEYVVKVNTHADGPALDIWRDEAGERTIPTKIHGALVQPALDTGWVPSATNRAVDTALRQGDHVRIFLRDADDVVEVSPSESELDDARLDGFAAGILAATMWHAQFPSLEELYPTVEDDEPMGEDEARAWITDNNTFPSGAVISASDDVDGDLYVYAPDTDPTTVETPDGWTAFRDGDTFEKGIGFLPEDDADYGDTSVPGDHIDAWDGFFEGAYNPVKTEDIDIGAVTRELQGVETPEECAKAIQDEHGDHTAHVSSNAHANGLDAPAPYMHTTLTDDDIPGGWTRYEDSQYLVKE